MAETQAGMGPFIRENIRRRAHCSNNSSSVSTRSKSDTQSGSSNDGAYHTDPVEMPGDSDLRVSQDMQWQSHLQTELGNQRDFACQKKPCEVYPATMKYDQDVEMLGIEAAILNDDSHIRRKSKNQAGVYFSDSSYTELNITDCFLSDQDKSLSSDLKAHHVGFCKAQPWWRVTGKEDLATMVVQKSLEHLENCDLPQPLTKYFRAGPVIGAKFVNHDQRFSNLENCTWNFSAIYSSQDSGKHLSLEVGPDMADMENIKAELLEALHNSQTRAREAEKAAEQALTEKEHVTTLLFREASQLFAYKQWFYLLQLENLCLQLKSGNQKMSTVFPATLPWVPCEKQFKERLGRGRKRRNGNQRNGINRCAIAFAVGLGLVGAGLLLGWTMGWLLPPV